MIKDESGGSPGLLIGRYSGYWNTGKGSTWEGGIREAAFANWCVGGGSGSGWCWLKEEEQRRSIVGAVKQIFFMWLHRSNRMRRTSSSEEPLL